jgi:acyl carrier protein
VSDEATPMSLGDCFGLGFDMPQEQERGYSTTSPRNDIEIKGEHMTENITSTLAKFIAEKILKQPNKVIKPDEALISSGLIDSFSLMDLALFVEDTFGVRIEDTELNAQTFDNLSQLTELIASRQ